MDIWAYPGLVFITEAVETILHWESLPQEMFTVYVEVRCDIDSDVHYRAILKTRGADRDYDDGLLNLR